MVDSCVFENFFFVCFHSNKENIDKKLLGVEECAICFDIVNSSGQLPKKACKTCRKKFHGNCIMKWFAKSNKSECPLCKSQFL